MAVISAVIFPMNFAQTCPTPLHLRDVKYSDTFLGSLLIVMRPFFIIKNFHLQVLETWVKT